MLLGREMAARDVEVRPDDVFLVSYPKSGNTWVRFLVGNLIAGDGSVTFADLETVIPDVYKHTASWFERLPGPRTIKSHEYFDPRYPKVVYIVRDPRDVVTSYFYYHAKVRLLDESYPMERFVERFVDGDLDPYGSWADNVSSWLGGRAGHPSFLLVRYEDLIDDTPAGLTRIASFLGLPDDAKRIETAANASAADRLRRMEKEQPDGWVTVRGTRQDVPFIRKAQSGGWREELDGKFAQAIREAWAPLMERVGYTD
jgi:hypothetical protein